MKKEAHSKEAKPGARFRFLRHDEFAALSQEERNRYLRLALEAIKNGHPLDDLPTRKGH